MNWITWKMTILNKAHLNQHRLVTMYLLERLFIWQTLTRNLFKNVKIGPEVEYFVQHSDPDMNNLEDPQIRLTAPDQKRNFKKTSKFG
jgi:hypothetical protein